jgi:hypothetical protein
MTAISPQEVFDRAMAIVSSATGSDIRIKIQKFSEEWSGSETESRRACDTIGALLGDRAVG